jgi:outer membrane immunogenic protein
VALRAGIAMDRALIYGKAGAVWARHDMTSVVLNQPSGSFNSAESSSATLNGILIGLGLEYALTSNWTTKLEYNFLGFAAKDVTINCVGPACFPPSFIQSMSSDKHVIKVGINYKLY